MTWAPLEPATRENSPWFEPFIKLVYVYILKGVNTCQRQP